MPGLDGIRVIPSNYLQTFCKRCRWNRAKPCVVLRSSNNGLTVHHCPLVAFRKSCRARAAETLHSLLPELVPSSTISAILREVLS
jgi:hypothetical protein